MSQRLTAQQQVTLANCLHAAASRADDDAATFSREPASPQLVKLYSSNARAYRALADMIDAARGVVLTD